MVSGVYVIIDAKDYIRYIHHGKGTGVVYCNRTSPDCVQADLRTDICHIIEAVRIFVHMVDAQDGDIYVHRIIKMAAQLLALCNCDSGIIACGCLDIRFDQRIGMVFIYLMGRKVYEAF